MTLAYIYIFLWFFLQSVKRLLIDMPGPTEDGWEWAGFTLRVVELFALAAALSTAGTFARVFH